MTLAASISDAFARAVADGAADRGTARRLVVGPSPDFGVLLVWALDDWDTYDSPSPERAVARVSNAEWLDRVDQLDPAADPGAIDAAKAELKQTIDAALRALATDPALGDFERLLALMEHGLNRSGYAELVAFRHPDGAGGVWPVHEHVRSGIDVYSWCALTGDGVTVFYPDGDGSGGTSRAYRFADLAWVRIDDEDDEVWLRVAGDVLDVRLTHGHTHEEWGGPSNEDVDKALIAHFRSRPDLVFERSTPPDPQDPAFARWRARLVEVEADGVFRVIRPMVDAHGIDAAVAFVDGLPADLPERDRVDVQIAEELLRAGRPRDALARLVALPPSLRLREWEEELQCLVALGRAHEALARAEELAKDRPAEKLAPYRALALGTIGQDADALALLDGIPPERRGPTAVTLLARAALLQATDPAGAEAALFGALARGWAVVRDLGPHVLDQSPGLLAVLERRRALEAQVRSHAVDALATRVATPLVAVDVAKVAVRPWRWRAERVLERTVDEVTDGRWLRGGDRVAWLDRGGEVVELDLGGVEPGPIASVGPWLYVRGADLAVTAWDLTDWAHPVQTGRAPAYLDDHAGALRAGDKVLVVIPSGGATVLDCRTPGEPAVTAVVGVDGNRRGRSSAQDGAVLGSTLVLATGHLGLVTADLSDPAAPRLLGAVAPDHDAGDGFARSLELLGDHAAVEVGGGRWLVELTDPAHPRSVAVVPRSVGWRVAARDDDRLVVLDDEGRKVWTLGLRPSPHVVAVARVEGLEGRPRAIAFDGEGLRVVTADGVYRLVREPVPARPDPAPAIAAHRDAILARVTAALGGVSAFELGALVLQRWHKTLQVVLDGPRSALGLEHPVCDDPPRVTIELDDLGPFEGGAPDDLPSDDAMAWHHAVQAAWSAVLAEVARALTATPELRALASGRVYLAVGERIAAVAVDPDRPWTPFRTEVTVARPSLDDQLRDWEQQDRLSERILDDAELRERALALAAAGESVALRIVAALEETDPETVLATYLAALDHTDDPGVLRLVLRHRGRPSVDAVVERLLVEGTPRARIQVAASTGRADEPPIVALVLELLQTPSIDHDLVCTALAAMNASLPEVLPALEAWMARAQVGSAWVPTLADAMFRAGVVEPPDALVRLAAREKSDEQYHAPIGIQALDQQGWVQSPACAVERKWTGRRLARRVLALAAQGDLEHPLWIWPPEPYPASWGYVLAAAAPYLAEAGRGPWLEEALVAHARADEAYAADHALLLRLLHARGEDNDATGLLRLAEAALAAPAGTFPPDAMRRVAAQAQQARVVEGFRLIAAHKIPEARRMADRALASEPPNGQALFLDARLAWLTEGAAEGIARAKAHLQRVDANDRAGKGRLLNLVGCALDALGKWDDAAGWFEQAVAAHQDPMYLANLAEVHDKRGATEDAVRFATNARRAGVKSAAVDRILAARGAG